MGPSPSIVFKREQLEYASWLEDNRRGLDTRIERIKALPEVPRNPSLLNQHELAEWNEYLRKLIHARVAMRKRSGVEDPDLLSDVSLNQLRDEMENSIYMCNRARKDDLERQAHAAGVIRPSKEYVLDVYEITALIKREIDKVRLERDIALLNDQKNSTLSGKRPGSSSGSSFIADSRIDELRKLSSPDFDFQKLICLCEELNSAFDNGNYYATAMLTRGVLDHVPPLFGHPTFTQVANNYSGGGRSFKETMQYLDGAARKVSDGCLHMPIRKSETLPTPTTGPLCTTARCSPC
jgi:hypothetical protein